MSKKDEAMKLALDYLLSKQIGAHIIAALREALAEQPAQQEPVAVGSLEALLGRYWDLAYLEGKSGISQGDKANEVLFAIRKLAGKPAQQEPVVFYRCNGCGHAYEQVHPTSCDCMEDGGFDRVEYYTSPPAQQGQVAWTLLLTGEHHGLVGKAGEKFVGHPEHYERVDVYTSPPAQRKPLTMQKRTSIVRANKSFHDKDEIDAYGIIDDVEAAHGIKENT